MVCVTRNSGITSSCVPRPQKTGGLSSASAASPGRSPGRGVAAEVHDEGESLGLEPHRLDRDGGALREPEQPDRGPGGRTRRATRAGASRHPSHASDPCSRGPRSGTRSSRAPATAAASGARSAATTNSGGQVLARDRTGRLVGAVAVEQHEERAPGALVAGRRPQHDVVVERRGSGARLHHAPSPPTFAAHLSWPRTSPPGIHRRVHVHVVGARIRLDRREERGVGRRARRRRRTTSASAPSSGMTNRAGDALRRDVDVGGDWPAR